MRLVKCPDCGGSVSAMADTCPQCNAPMFDEETDDTDDPGAATSSVTCFVCGLTGLVVAGLGIALPPMLLASVLLCFISLCLAFVASGKSGQWFAVSGGIMAVCGFALAVIVSMNR